MNITRTFFNHGGNSKRLI